MTARTRGKVLIVDDEPNARKVLSAILSDVGYSILEAKDAERGIRSLDRHDVDAVITDLKMPGKDGTAVFEHAMQHHPDVPVIFLTAFGSVESAVHAITRGAFYYFIKPPDYQKLKSILARAVEQRRLKRELKVLKERLSGDEPGWRIIGRTPEMQKVCDTVEAVRDSESSVLICGETGTGKEVVARALHFTSTRREMPFVAVNCAAIPKGLMESELFGYERGAFTGAVSRKLGKFEEASGGTVFLDEVGELDPELQAKLLRVLQEGEVERLGSNRSIKVSFRLVSSTNRDLDRMIRTGEFREDLYYRINVIRIDVPPLRERRDDIPLLLSEFLKEFCLKEKKVLTVSEEAAGALRDHAWPGNVRQFRNVIERAVVLAKHAVITLKELPEEFSAAAGQGGKAPQRTLKEIEAETVASVLRECDGNVSRAAKLLGISRKTFYKRLRDAGIEEG